MNYPLKLKINPLINPLARNSKIAWCNTFRKHVTMSTPSTNTKLVLTGDSVIADFDNCKDIFDKFLSFALKIFALAETKYKKSFGVCVI